jgi:hypothetical protein
LDPDNVPVHPHHSNYFSGTTDPLFISGSLSKIGIYRLNWGSSILSGGAVGTSNSFDGSYNVTFTANDITAVPEPSSATILCLGGLGMMAYAWRRRRKYTPSLSRSYAGLTPASGE